MFLSSLIYPTISFLLKPRTTVIKTLKPYNVRGQNVWKALALRHLEYAPVTPVKLI